MRRALLSALLAPTLLAAQAPDSATIAALRWRQVGPANMAGRIADIEGLPHPSRTYFVAAAAGGVWKTTNAGNTFRPVFDNYGVASLGDLAIAPSDTNTIYLGTGEPNARNSHSPGAGLFKSTDGGLTWKFSGLKETQNIGRIQVDPRDKNVVYVAAMGHSWGANKERGLFKSTDGGATWTNIKFVDERTGAIDVQLNPKNPDEVWVAMYERVRGPYFLKSGGPGSGIWKSTDAGKTFTQVTGGGLPAGELGRVSIAFAPSNPAIMYLMVEADTLKAAKGAKGTPTDPKAKPQTSPSGLYRSEDGGKTWTRTNNENVRPFYYSQVRVHPTNPNRVWWSSTPVKVSSEGGKNARNATVGIHVDHHAMWIDPKDPTHHIVGNDGGIAQSWDDGGSYDFINTFAIGQFYNVSFDMQTPYRVCGGLQDNGSWCGPSRRKNGPVTNAMWFTFNGGDGFVTAQDPTDPNILYGESQGGNIGRYNYATGERTAIVKPNWRPKYTQWEDSILVERPDTTAPMTKAQKARIDGFRRQQKADSAAFDLRWNWNTPFFLSKHNPSVFYTAANRVMKSVKRGDDLFFISPDLTYADTMKIRVSTRTTGGITIDATGAETFGTIVSLNESAIRPGILYAGTDDGRVWVSKDDGGSWTEVAAAANATGVPAGAYVSRIEPSKFDSLTFYVTYDDHRRDNYTPYVLATTDFGKSFTSIVNNLPADKTSPNFVHVIREDVKNPNLLFVGTDIGAYVSVDKGKTWAPFMTGLPNVPVHDLQIHPRDAELIAGTHGRSIMIVDIAPLQQYSKDVAAKDAHLFAPRLAQQYGEPPVNGESTGNKIFQAPSPQYGADIWYKLAKPAGGPVRVVIQDATGDTIRTLNGPGQAGVHRVTWNFQGRQPAPAKLSPAGVRDSILNARRVIAVLDSIEKEGNVPKPMMDMARQAMLGGPQGMQQLIQRFGGGFGGGGGGAGGRPGAWNERPAESAAPQRGQGEGAQAAAAEGPMDQGAMSQVFQTIQRATRGQGFGGGGGGFGRGPQIVEPGDYKVSMTVGGKTESRILRVERVNGSSVQGFPFSDDELTMQLKKAIDRASRGMF